MGRVTQRAQATQATAMSHATQRALPTGILGLLMMTTANTEAGLLMVSAAAEVAAPAATSRTMNRVPQEADPQEAAAVAVAAGTIVATKASGISV